MTYSLVLVFTIKQDNIGKVFALKRKQASDSSGKHMSKYRIPGPHFQNYQLTRSGLRQQIMCFQTFLGGGGGGSIAAAAAVAAIAAGGGGQKPIV